MGRNKIKVITLTILLMVISLFTGCSQKQDKTFATMEDFKDAKVGVLSGSSFDVLANEHLPDAEKMYYMHITDLVLNLNQGKIDGILMDEGFFTPLRWENDELGSIKIDMPASNYGVAFPKSSKGDSLRIQVDKFIDDTTVSGELKDLTLKWFANEEPTHINDFSSLPATNGTLKVATTAECKPYSYLKNGKSVGFSIDLLYNFAKKNGYGVDLDVLDFGALLPGLIAERYDFAISSITITDERKESVSFSKPYYKSPIIMGLLKENIEESTYKTLDDFYNSRIGVMTGSIYDDIAKERFPDASREYYSVVSDLVLSLEQGKIDGYISDLPYCTAAIWEGANVKAIEEPLIQSEAAFILRKNDESLPLLNQINSFVKGMKDDGSLEKLNKKWLGNKEPDEHVDLSTLEDINGTLKVAAATDLKPYVYLKNGEPTGFEIELLYLFAKEYGYDLDFAYTSFEGIIPGIVNGIFDIGTSGFTITEERKESVYFTECHFVVDVVMIIKSDVKNDKSFFEEFKEGFEKTFIREDRWKLILEGVFTTILISICSVIFGTILGFGLYMLSTTELRILKKITLGVGKVYSRIVAGTPVVVILMILYYVVFGKVKDISGVLVAVIGFSLTFGAFVYDHMNVSVGSIDKGQTEAAYALGYTKNRTFIRIIFPQAMNVFVPSYCANAVELVKATAVVGYIAVTDLTKMGDIIRSNTYEAFFPLITTAVIYFILTWLLSLLLGLTKYLYDPTRRSKEKILEGVDK